VGRVSWFVKSVGPHIVLGVPPDLRSRCKGQTNSLALLAFPILIFILFVIVEIWARATNFVSLFHSGVLVLFFPPFLLLFCVSNAFFPCRYPLVVDERWAIENRDSQ
jgi:hypothetical protein